MATPAVTPCLTMAKMVAVNQEHQHKEVVLLFQLMLQVLQTQMTAVTRAIMDPTVVHLIELNCPHCFSSPSLCSSPPYVFVHIHRTCPLHFDIEHEYIYVGCIDGDLGTSEMAVASSSSCYPQTFGSICLEGSELEAMMSIYIHSPIPIRKRFLVMDH